jgi:hypothetical protein
MTRRIPTTTNRRVMGVKILPVAEPQETIDAVQPQAPELEHLDEQTIINGLVFKVHGQRDHAGAMALGEELARRWNSLRDAELEGDLLEFDNELLDVEEEPNCEDYFEGAGPTYNYWQVCEIQSRTGDSAYVAIILRGDYPCDCECVGVFHNAMDAEAALKKRGYISLEHYQHAHTSER